MHGLPLIQSQPAQAQDIESQTNGDHSHINNGTHRLSHFWPLSYFHSLHQPKTPVCTKKLSPKVLYFFHTHCPKFWKIFTQRPQIGWNLRKRYPNAPYFYGFCHWKTPYFLPCMHMFERNVAPSNTVCRSWKIVYSWNRIVQFGEYF